MYVFGGKKGAAYGDNGGACGACVRRVSLSCVGVNGVWREVGFVCGEKVVVSVFGDGGNCGWVWLVLDGTKAGACGDNGVLVGVDGVCGGELCVSAVGDGKSSGFVGFM